MVEINVYVVGVTALDVNCTPCPVESFCKCRHGRAHTRQLRQPSLLDLLDVFVAVAAVPRQPCRGVAACSESR